MIDSNLIPRRHVPGSGRVPAEIMLVGEAPGRHENARGVPFVGDSGDELNRYMASAGLSRYDCYVTNVYKYWPLADHRGKQLPPSPDEIKEGEAELRMEIEIVRPRIIVAIGAHAARWFLGPKFRSMRRDFGIPQPRPEDPSIVIMPVTHPAAGLHNDREQVQISEGFMRLGRLVRGQIPPHPPVDEYPETRYTRIYDVEKSGPPQHLEARGAELIANLLAGQTVIAIDTEGSVDDPWCLTFSIRPGEAWLVRSTERECLEAIDRHINAPFGICTVICHYLAHDIPVAAAMGVRISRHRAIQADGSLSLRCTMSEAFLLGGIEPKGLKPLGWRLLGVDMLTYEELVGPTEAEISRRYIESVWELLRCGACGGEGKVPVASTRMVADPNCGECGGSGKIAVGKKGQPLKNPKPCGCRVEEACYLKTLDKCPVCVSGALIPLPERELVFDAKKAQFRWKQPQALGKWLRKRLSKGMEDENEVEDADLFDAASGPLDQGAEGDNSGGGEGDVSETGVDSGDEPATGFFALRRDWLKLFGRSDFEYVEALCGRMPRTTLSEVEAREGEKAVTDYACADADVALRIAPILERRLSSLGLLAVREQDAAFIPMISRMEQLGMRIDRQHFEAFHLHLAEKIEKNRAALGALLGLDRPTNPTRDRVADLLFNQLGLKSVKLTKSGSRESVDDDVLGALKAQLKKRPDDPDARFAVQVIDHVSDDREYTKLDSSYVLKILRHADRYDRIHTKLDYTVAATGRLTSSDPINLQTLPNPDNYLAELANDYERNYGLRTRKGFIARPGYKLGEIDYSSIEMVVGAHLSQDPGMLRIFREGLDPHKYAANLMFEVAYDQVAKYLRTQCKPLNFGCWYGLSAIGLQAQFASLPSGAIEKTEAECQELIDRYYAAFPGVLEWKERLWGQAERDGFVRDLFGRIRWVPGLRSGIRKVRAAAEREAANMPIQSTANGIIRIGSRRIWEHDLPEMWSMGVDANVIMQTHDANTIEAPEEHIGWVMPVIAESMRSAVELSVPIKVDWKIGANLAEVK